MNANDLPDFRALTEGELNLLARYGRTPDVTEGAWAELEGRWEVAEGEMQAREFLRAARLPCLGD